LRRLVTVLVPLALLALIARLGIGIGFGNSDSGNTAATASATILTICLSALAVIALFYLGGLRATRHRERLASLAPVTFVAHRQQGLVDALSLLRDRANFTVSNAELLTATFVVAANESTVSFYANTVEPPIFTGAWEDLEAATVVTIPTSSGSRPAIELVAKFDDRKVVLQVLAGSVAWNGYLYASAERTRELAAAFAEVRRVH
jgi:hypothetical protein